MFAASHGKGPADGIGGAMKWQVRNFVKSRKGTVFNATDFTRATCVMGTEVQVVQMRKKEIEHRNETLNMITVFQKAMPLVSISKMHRIFVKKKMALNVFFGPINCRKMFFFSRCLFQNKCQLSLNLFL